MCLTGRIQTLSSMTSVAARKSPVACIGWLAYCLLDVGQPSLKIVPPSFKLLCRIKEEVPGHYLAKVDCNLLGYL